MKSFLQISGIILVLAVTVFAQGEPAQTTMTLTGAVYDWNGAVIVTGTLVSAQDENGKKFEAVMNDEGYYKLQLPLGVYKVEATAPGFCSTTIEGFRVVNATHGRMSLDFVLEVSPSHRRKPCIRIKIKKNQGEEAEGKQQSLKTS